MGKNAKNEEKPVKNETAKNLDVLIVGGGAAGLMAAITAAKNGANLVLLQELHTTEYFCQSENVDFFDF